MVIDRRLRYVAGGTVTRAHTFICTCSHTHRPKPFILYDYRGQNDNREQRESWMMLHCAEHYFSHEKNDSVLEGIQV